MHMLYVLPEHRAAGVGTQQVRVWEESQRAAGHQVVLMTPRGTLGAVSLPWCGASYAFRRRRCS
jgi:hypothetical protein